MAATSIRKARERDARENLILDKATDLLLSHGYLGLNLDVLARNIDYSKGTIYQHFETKEDIVLGVAARALEQRAILFQRAASFSGRSREKMTAIGVADALFVRLHPGHFQVEQLMHQSSIWEKTSEAQRRRFGINTDRCMGVMRQIIEEGVRAGDLPTDRVKPAEIIFGLWAMSSGSHVAAQSPSILKELGVEDAMKTLALNQSAYLDGVGWRRLSTELDYQAVRARVLREVFPEVPPMGKAGK